MDVRSCVAIFTVLLGTKLVNAKPQGSAPFAQQPNFQAPFRAPASQMYYAPRPPPPPPQPMYVSPPQTSYFNRPSPGLSFNSYLSPQMATCPGSCPHSCAPDCNWRCCFPPPPPPPPPPPCPASCPSKCYPECNEACCKPGPPPFTLFSKRAEKTAVACQGKKLKIKCQNRADRIVLYSTFYGRKDDSVCHHKVLPSTGKCVGQEMNINQKIHDLCSGVNRCTVAANNAFLAKKDTLICPGHYKYLMVTYKCTQHPELFEACPLPCATPKNCWPNCSPKCCTPAPPPPPPPPQPFCPGSCPNSCFSTGCSKRCCTPPPPPPPPPAPLLPPPPQTRFAYPSSQYPSFYPPAAAAGMDPMANFAPNSPVTPKFLEFPPKPQALPQPQYQSQFQNPYTRFGQPFRNSMSSACAAPCPTMCAPACSRSCCAAVNTKRTLYPGFGRYYG